MINAWQWEKSKAIAFPACKSRLNFRVRDQFEIKILKVWLMNTTYCLRILKKIELDPAIIWKVATCQRITWKKHSNSVLPYLSPRYGQAILVNICQLIKTWMYNIRLQAPKLARKCEIKHWYACDADRRKVGVRSRDCQISYLRGPEPTLLVFW